MMRTMRLAVSFSEVREIAVEDTAPAIGVTQGRPAVLGSGRVAHRAGAAWTVDAGRGARAEHRARRRVPGISASRAGHRPGPSPYRAVAVEREDVPPERHAAARRRDPGAERSRLALP